MAINRPRVFTGWLASLRIGGREFVGAEEVEDAHEVNVNGSQDVIPDPEIRRLPEEVTAMVNAMRPGVVLENIENVATPTIEEEVIGNMAQQLAVNIEEQLINGHEVQNVEYSGTLRGAYNAQELDDEIVIQDGTRTRRISLGGDVRVPTAQAVIENAMRNLTPRSVEFDTPTSALNNINPVFANLGLAKHEIMQSCIDNGITLSDAFTLLMREMFIEIGPSSINLNDIADRVNTEQLKEEQLQIGMRKI